MGADGALLAATAFLIWQVALLATPSEEGKAALQTLSTLPAEVLAPFGEPLERALQWYMFWADLDDVAALLSKLPPLARRLLGEEGRRAPPHLLCAPLSPPLS